MDIEVFDRGTGFNDTIAIIDDEGSANGSLIILDKDGNKLCNTSDLGSANAIAVGDFNEDGNKREIVVGSCEGTCAPFSGAAIEIYAFYSNCTLIWKNTTADVEGGGGNIKLHEVETGDLDNDGYYDDIAMVDSLDKLRIFNG